MALIVEPRGAMGNGSPESTAAMALAARSQKSLATTASRLVTRACSIVLQSKWSNERC